MRTSSSIRAMDSDRPITSMVSNEVDGFRAVFARDDGPADAVGDDGLTPRQERLIRWLALGGLGLMAAWWVVGAILAH